MTSRTLFIASLLLAVSVAVAAPSTSIIENYNNPDLVCKSIKRQYLEQLKMHQFLMWLYNTCRGGFECMGRRDHVEIHKWQLMKIEEFFEKRCMKNT